MAWSSILSPTMKALGGLPSMDRIALPRCEEAATPITLMLEAAAAARRDCTAEAGMPNRREAAARSGAFCQSTSEPAGAIAMRGAKSCSPQ